MKKTILLLFFINLILSCKNNKLVQNNFTTLNLNFENEQKRISTNDLFKEGEIIPLETNESSLISKINRIYIYKNKIYILDKKFNTIFIFNDKGKYISKIKNLGKGPGEYLSLNDFAIDTLHNRIILLSNRPSSVLYYDLNGVFQKKIANKDYCFYVSANNDNLYLAHYGGLSNYYLSVNNSQYLEICKDYQLKDFFNDRPRLNQNYNTYFYTIFDQNVYKLLNDSVILKYKINFGNRFVTQQMIKDKKKIDLMNFCFKNKVINSISDFIENDKYIIFRLHPIEKIVICDKKGNLSNVYAGFSEKNADLNLDNLIAPDGIRNKVAFLMSADQFINNVTINSPEVKNEEKYKKYLKVANLLKNSDNPVILLYNFK